MPTLLRRAAFFHRLSMTGFHDLMGRMGPIAVIDLFGTLVIAFGLAWYLRFDWKGYVMMGVALLVLGELVHLLLGIETPVTALVSA